MGIVNRTFFYVLIVVALVVALAGCQDSPRLFTREFMEAAGFTAANDSEVDRLLKLYEAEFNTKVETPIYFKKELKEVGESVIGYCMIFKGEKYIALNSIYWEGVVGLKKEMLLFHELLHCERDLKHNDRVGTDGCPVSLMYPNMMDPVCYLKHRSSYLDQFRTSSH